MKRSVVYLVAQCGIGKTLIAGSTLQEYATTILYVTSNQHRRGLDNELQNWFGKQFRVVIFGEEPIVHGRKTVLVLNYEKLWSGLHNQDLINYNPDTLVLDEVHELFNSKSARYKQLAKMLGKMKALHTVIPMTATPLSKTLNDLKNVAELVSGEKPPFSNRLTDRNIMLAYTYFTQHGLCLDNTLPTPKKDIISIVPSPALMWAAVNGELKHPKDVQVYSWRSKLLAVPENKWNHALIFCEYTSVIYAVQEFLERREYIVQVCTGDSGSDVREEIKEQFIADVKNGKKTVILCTRAMSQSVDGLQTACRRQIWLSIPPTPRFSQQLEGRTTRNGGLANQEIVLPMLDFDQRHYDILRNRCTISDIVFRGEALEKLFNESKYRKETKGMFTEFVQRLKDNAPVDLPTTLAEFDEPEEYSPNLNRQYNEFDQQEKRRRVSKSAKTFARLQAHPEEEDAYIAAQSRLENKWSAGIPRHRIEDLLLKEYGKQQLASKDFCLADLGCGPNFTIGADPERKPFGCSIDGYSNTSNSPQIAATNITKLTAKAKYNAVTLSLALQSLDAFAAFKSAHKMCLDGGKLFVAESFGRHGKGMERAKKTAEAMKKHGWTNIERELRGRFFYLVGTK
jgi:superfamily II DNA or RNA helicase